MNEKKKAALSAGIGATLAAGASTIIGGMGLAVSGTAVGIGVVSFAAVGAVIGLAGYGLYKAFDGESKKKR